MLHHLKCVLMALLFVPPWCLGAEFPMRAVRLIAPFPPGGPTDVLARTLAGQLTQRWKQQVVVDNRPGAAGNIGAELAARATPDGHTLLMGTVATHAINESLYRQLPYSPHKDFAAVALAAQTPSAIVVHPSVAARYLPEFLVPGQGAWRGHQLWARGRRHNCAARSAVAAHADRRGGDVGRLQGHVARD